MMKYFFIFLFQLLFIDANTQIVIDEIFDDWEPISSAYNDAMNDGRNGVDFGVLKLHSDSDYIYIHLTTSKEINLQNDNDLVLYLDIDNDRNTGFTYRGIGADLVYYFGDRMGYYYSGGTRRAIFHTNIDLISLPTVSSDKFEMALKRTIKIGSSTIEFGNEIRIVLQQEISGGDIMPDELGGVVYSLNNRPYSVLDYSINKRNSDHIRILSYNVERDQLFKNGRPFRSIIPLIKPDILCFQEIYDHSSEDVSNLITDYFGGIWYHAKQGRDIIVISRYPIVKSTSIGGNGAFLIDKDGVEILIINAHLFCCAADKDRQVEVDEIMDYIRESQEGRSLIPIDINTPIVILGDMNFVGKSNQRTTLIEGDIEDELNFGNDYLPDWDDSYFEDARPITTGYPATFTWNDDGSSFPKGRLDYVIYSGSVLQLENSYILNTRGMEESELHGYQLNSHDTDEASDHLPVVTDFSMVDLFSSIDIIEENMGIVSCYPNPTTDGLNFNILMKEAGWIKWIVVDQLGRTIKSSKVYLKEGNNDIYINTGRLTEGVYYLRVFQEIEMSCVEFVVW